MRAPEVRLVSAVCRALRRGVATRVPQVWVATPGKPGWPTQALAARLPAPVAPPVRAAWAVPVARLPVAERAVQLPALVVQLPMVELRVPAAVARAARPLATAA